MTKEDAIKYLKQLYPNGGHCWLDEQRIEAIDMAVKALQEEPVSEFLNTESMIESYKQRLISQANGMKNSPFIDMCLASYKHGINETLDTLNLSNVQRTVKDRKEPVSEELEEVSKEPRIWVARNHPNNGALGLYNGKPIRTRYCWEPTGEMRFLERQWFPEVTWENSPKELVVKDKEPISENFEEALAREWQGYNDRGAATVDALEDNTQELTFAKGFYRGAKWQKKQTINKACSWIKSNINSDMWLRELRKYLEE